MRSGGIQVGRGETVGAVGCAAEDASSCKDGWRDGLYEGFEVVHAIFKRGSPPEVDSSTALCDLSDEGRKNSL